ncbi:MAG TPA: M24 family metallopeptidase [Actinomycetes bacterium]|nr:M24 family metallopeptidase [Actinomycetes bacterium]
MSTPGEVPDDELAARRERLLAEAERLGLDAILAYGANRSGSAVPWLACWQVTREAAVVLRRGERPVLLVGFPNHVPNARRVARDCEVLGAGGRTSDTVLEVLRQSSTRPVRRVGVIGPVPHRLWAALSEGGVDLVEMDQAYVAARMRKTAYELSVLRHGAALTDASGAALVAAAVPGATELDLVAAVEAAYAGTGGTNHIHYVAATSMAEPDRCAPGQWPTDRLLETGSVVVFELSTTWGTDYPGQLLRTVTVDAEPTPLYRDLHDVAVACLDAIVALLRPGALPADLLAAADLVLEAGFTTVDDLVHGFGGGYLPPVLSHRGPPTGAEAGPLEEGMTVVVQPNVCTPDLSAGVQTGELFEVTIDGARSLHRFPTGLLRGGDQL